MATRLDLQCLLENIMGNRNVYFNRPQSGKLNYPCIIFSLDDINVQSADGMNYKIDKRYQIILVDPNPVSSYVDELMKIPRINYVRSYISDGLSHNVFNLYY